MQLWLYYNLCILRRSRGSLCWLGLVSYHDLLADPQAIISRIIGDMAFGPSEPEARQHINDYVTGEDNHFPRTATNVLEAPHIAQAIKEMWRLLESWHTIEAAERQSAITRL